MTRNLTKAFLILFLLAFAVAALFVSFRYMTYFDLKEIKTVFDGPVDGISNQAKEIIVDLNGFNLFEINSGKVKNKLLSTPCIESVKIRKIYPSEISIVIKYREFGCRITSQDSEKGCLFLADKNGIVEVSREIFDLYSPLNTVEFDKDYLQSIKNWGVDTGFVQMVELVSNVQKNLITAIKYDNNKGNEFGCLKLYFQSYGVQLNVREPVTYETLDSAIEMIKLESSSNNQVSVYDLYSGGLFGRN